MNKKFSHIFLPLLLVVLFSCEQAIRYDRKDYETRPVVWAFLEADSTPQVIIQQTLPIEGWIEQDREQQFLRGLQPILSINSESIILNMAEIKLIGNSNAYSSFLWGRRDSIILPYYQTNSQLSHGDKIQLAFRHNDQDYEASSFIPEKVEIERIELNQKIITDLFSSYSQDLIRVYFTDNPNENNAYRIRASLRGLDTRPIYDDSTGEIIGRDSLYYTIMHHGTPVLDTEIDGEAFYADFPTYHFQYTPFKQQFYLNPDGKKVYYQNLEIRIEAMDYDAGVYLRSIEGQNQTSGDPLSEAVFLKGNIEGGLGIFSGMSLSDSMHFKLLQ